MAEFLDTTAISYNVERLLKTAKQRLVIISPYLKLRPRIRELIEDAGRRGVRIEVVYGKNKASHETGPLAALRNVQVLFCKSVHAKCYISDDSGIITSLNLYDFSEAKNYEMGVLFQRSVDTDLFQNALAEADRLIRIARSENVSAVILQQTRLSKAHEEAEKLTTAKLAMKLGLRSSALFSKLVGHGYLEIREGGQRFITPAGKLVGGEFRFGKGPYFLWPADLQI